jgi:hypothetical protein
VRIRRIKGSQLETKPPTQVTQITQIGDIEYIEHIEQEYNSEKLEEEISVPEPEPPQVGYPVF